jgi:pilus assembly protein CpaF
MSIRKHHRGGFTEEQLLESGTFTIAQRDYLKDLVLSRKNIVIAGPTGEGKTTLLRYLASLIPETDRVLIIEERIELNIEGPNRVSLLAQNPVAEDSTVVSMDQLLTHALRMQPQRMILGELRSAEALNLLIAFGTGHNGGLTTIHANDPEQAVDRLVFMMSSAGRQAYSDEKLVDLIRMSVDNIIYVNHRKLQSIAKVGGKGEPLITMVDI